MFSMCHHDVPWYFTKFYHQTCLFCNRAKSVLMEKSKFLDASIGLDESVTFHYGLPCVVSLLCVLAPKNLKYAKVGWFWCSLAQADPQYYWVRRIHEPRLPANFPPAAFVTHGRTQQKESKLACQNFPSKGDSVRTRSTRHPE